MTDCSTLADMDGMESIPKTSPRVLNHASEQQTPEVVNATHPDGQQQTMNEINSTNSVQAPSTMLPEDGGKGPLSATASDNSGKTPPGTTVDIPIIDVQPKGNDGASSLEAPDAQNKAEEMEHSPVADLLHTSDEKETSSSVTDALEALLGPVTPPAVQSDMAEPQPEASIHISLSSTDRHEADVDKPESVEALIVAPSTQLNHEAELNGDESERMILDMNNDVTETGEAEFETDSSPLESSSDDSSDSDDSSSDGSEAGEAYELLTAEEQARILMEGDGGSDDEATNRGKGPGPQLRTKNEVPEEIVPKPNVTITAEMPIEELGIVEAVVENILVVKAKISGEYRVLESGSVLCLADRSVIGAVSETLGRVQQPLYSVRFTNATEIAQAGLSAGTKVFYSEQHSTYVFTQSLKAYKGSDASNIHDEEVDDEEMEFSDDEAEAEHKRRVKQKRIERRGGRTQQNGQSHGDHPLRNEVKAPLSYDDVDDAPYRTLARPDGYANKVGQVEAPEEDLTYQAQNNARDAGAPSRGRGRGDRGRGRGDRGDRGRGHERGRGRGGYHDRRGDGFSQPARDMHTTGPTPSRNMPPQYSPGFAYQQGSPSQPQPQSQPPSNQATSFAPQFPPYPYPAQQQQQPHQPYPPPQFMPYQSQSGWTPPVLPPGTYINPAFYGQQPQYQQANQPQQYPAPPPFPQSGSGQPWMPPVPHPQDPGVAELLKHLHPGRK